MESIPQQNIIPAYEFRMRFTYASTAFGTVYLGKERLMDFITNLNYVLPEGLFEFSYFDSPKFKREVVSINVPKHVGIEIHPADYFRDLSGCFAVGSFGGNEANPKLSYAKIFAGSNSTAYLDKFIAHSKTSGIRLINLTYSECINVYLTGRG